MTVKRYTIEEKIEMVERALASEKTGISIHRSSEDFKVSDVSLYLWIKQYKNGELKEESSFGSLLNAIEEDGNGLVDLEESEKLEIVVVFGDNPDMLIKVDDPGLENHFEQIAAIKELVFSRFQIFIKV